MDRARIARLRWRRRGAWMWPVFAGTIVLDAVIGHLLPPAGETQALLGAALLAAFLNLLAVLLISRPLGALLRRRRPDLPATVARDYGGTVAIAGVSALLLLAGVVHRPTILHHHGVRRDAIVRAQAWVGAHAPEPFRRNMSVVDVYAIDPDAIYRICIPAAARVEIPRSRTYCVVVRDRQPFPGGVSFDGYESNSTYSAGTG